jgi:hypothetical protein
MFLLGIYFSCFSLFHQTLCYSYKQTYLCWYTRTVKQTYLCWYTRTVKQTYLCWYTRTVKQTYLCWYTRTVKQTCVCWYTRTVHPFFGSQYICYIYRTSDNLYLIYSEGACQYSNEIWIDTPLHCKSDTKCHVFCKWFVEWSNGMSPRVRTLAHGIERLRQ